MNKPEEYKLYQAPNANTISFHSMNTEWVMRITADRRIEVADGVDVTEAARLVLDAMQSMLDVGLEKAVKAEREACAKLVEPDEEHRKEAQHYIGGEEGVELLDNRAATIRARGQA
jgi:hypothetical protein